VEHVATHTLPGELSCLAESLVALSPPPGAPNADASFLKASEVLNLKLDADLVVLSACNTGGPAGPAGLRAQVGAKRSPASPAPSSVLARAA